MQSFFCFTLYTKLAHANEEHRRLISQRQKKKKKMLKQLKARSVCSCGFAWEERM